MINDMKNAELSIYAVKAAILAFRGKITSCRQIRRWKNNKVKIAYIHPDDSCFPGHQVPKERGELFDVEYDLDDTPVSIKNADAYCLRSAVKRMNATYERTVLMTDDPRYIRSTETSKMLMTVGISASNGKAVLYEKGADIVLDSLDRIILHDGSQKTPSFSQRLPNLFSGPHKFRSIWGHKKPVFFFDYDGTLTPIIKDSGKAFLGEDMRERLHEISHLYHVAVISGRDLEDLKRFIRLDSIIYAGSHGFRVSGPGGLYMEHQQAKDLLGGFDKLEGTVRNKLEQKIPGVEIERKRYAIAIHYRKASDKALLKIKNEVNELTGGTPDFETGKGKKILEIRPSMDWHKGKAVNWILQELGLLQSIDYIPIYIGDDITDEDAFRTLVDVGLGILVGELGHPTAARYQLKDVEQVKQFMHFITHT